jgi:BASS family bile acid:Na+ symporter
VQALSKLIPITVLVFVVSSMLAVGLSLTVKQILAPLRDARLVTLALMANFVLMPISAVLISRVMQLDTSLGIALLLLGTAAGAPFLPKLASTAGGNLAFAVGLMVLLMVLTVAYMPIVLPLLLEGVSVDPFKIARSLIVLMLIPLAAGLLVKARYGAIAERGALVLNKVSTLSLALMIGLMLITNVRNIAGLFGSRRVLESVMFLLAGLRIGWFLGGSAEGVKSVLALGTAQRNIAAALVVGGQNFTDPQVVVMIVVVALVGMLLLMPFARIVARRSEQPISEAAKKANYGWGRALVGQEAQDSSLSAGFQPS